MCICRAYRWFTLGPRRVREPQPSSWPSSPSSSPPKELAPLVIPSTLPPTYPLNLEAAVKRDPRAQSPTPNVVLTEGLPVYTASRSSNKSTLPSPCSVDDRVPSLPSKPPAAQLQHLEQTRALNPSSSRFTLSIPLLGCTKVPLGSVLEKEKEKGAFFVRFLICVDALVLSLEFSMLIWLKSRHPHPAQPLANPRILSISNKAAITHL